MKRWRILLLFSLGMVLSCTTAPQQGEAMPSMELTSPSPTTPPAEPQKDVVDETPPPLPLIEVIIEVPEEEIFTPVNISQEMYEHTKAEVQALVGDLNRIIRARNYNAWTENLAESYLREISSKPFLDEKTEELYRRDQMVATNLGRDPRLVQKKILRTARDYFELVVAPSRSNDHVDDIEFISDIQVKAYTVDTRGHRLILYHLEIIDSQWKITS